MACCGCFVPAEYASFKFFDSLLSRLSNEDDLERSLSTFSNEMITASMILGSRVLIDELGRGTSPQEGIGIAHAIAEELIARKCIVLFTTHFTDLPSTLARYPSVVNLHLSVQNARINTGGMRMLYDYKVCDGASKEGVHYGLELAKLADLPGNVLTEATKVAKLLKERELERKRSERLTNHCFVVYCSLDANVCVTQLATQLKQILNISTLPDADLARYLLRLQNNVGDELEKTFLDGE
ncbi:related to MSH4-meiosis-specific protein [Serendipita indica DSM 11827]|uniref:Related to MSH4-meiosis-specific protein n=1 Tax=Serendipita indica (strain DSM 11827) TaxID=1109443 RepID=G4TLE6_SERID|nr:related to MSH4-meiosis-specific protein [Serendipita indica DSM 11827]